ncbi:beta-glucanase, partial [Escherichia coli]|nr:beta-glucanase [Escherichia coli]
MMRILFLLLTLLSFSSFSETMFTPGRAWYDSDGNIINAHGGGILKFEDKYYWFGELRTEGRDNTGKVSVYSSTDLYKWHN